MQWKEFRSHVHYLPASDIARVEKAFALAQEVHKGQKRRSGDPYFSHLLATASMLAAMEADGDTLIAAFLHDAVEDTPLTLDEIDQQFGGKVRMLIDGVTKLEKTDIGEKPSLDEQTETLRKIFTLMEQDIRIMVIKLVDRLHNMQTAEFLEPERQLTLAQETLDVYVKIADRLSMRDMRDELEALCLSILYPQNFSLLHALRSANETAGKNVAKKIQRAMQESKVIGGESRAIFESATWERLQQQETGQTTATGTAPYVVAVVVQDIDDCYRTMGVLHQHWQREILSFQDFINSPTINGYRGLHTTIILEDGTRVRCKIRTKEMQEYAHRGITLFCFHDNGSRTITNIPWIQRIVPLSKDTENRSRDFWQSLQSDVLGESITVHGPGDETILVPKGSTAIDAAFYLFGKEAAHLKTVHINGVEVSLGTLVKNADALDITVGKRLTVSREWLQWSHTGLATAKIRAIISTTQSKDEKYLAGKTLLQKVMHEQKRGFIEEFREQGMLRSVQSLGYFSMEDVYIAIAEGHLDPIEVYNAIFTLRDPSQQEEKKLCYIRYVVSDRNTLDTLNLVHRKFGTHLEEVHYRSRRKHVLLKLKLNPEEQHALKRELEMAGAQDVVIHLHWKRTTSVIVLVGMLWGLDPVAAYFLLQGSVSVFDFTFVRFFVFLLAALALFLFQKKNTRQQLNPISLFHWSLLLSGISLFFTGICTYFSLKHLPPLQYILLVIISSVLPMACVRAKKRKERWYAPVLMLITCVIVLIVLVTVQGFSTQGLSFGLLSGLGFWWYTEVSRRYQEKVAKIQARYAAYLMWLSVTAFCISLFLLPFTHLSTLSFPSLLIMTGFTLIFVFLPYSLYYILMRRIYTASLERHLLFAYVATMLGEFILTKSFSVFLALPVLLALILWEYSSNLHLPPFHPDPSVQRSLPTNQQ